MSIAFFFAQLAFLGPPPPTAGAATEPAPTTPAPTTPAPTTPAPTTAPADPAAPSTEAPPPTAEPTPPTEPAATPTAAPATTTATPATETVAPPTKPVRRPPRERGQFTFYWDMNQNVGSSYRFVDDFSVRGFSAGFSYRIKPIVSVGVLFGYTYTDDVVRATRHFENSALTATELRSTETLPIMATATVHIPTGRGGIRGRGWAEPFVGLGIGTYYTQRRADAGWVYADQTGWHFGLMPMLGVQIDTPGPQVILSSRFNWAAKTDDSPQELYMTFNVGLGFFAF